MLDPVSDSEGFRLWSEDVSFEEYHPQSGVDCAECGCVHTLDDHLLDVHHLLHLA